MSKTKAWMPLFVADYLADTTHMSTSQHGAYLLLLICQWRTGPLLDDDAQLARICRASLEEWRSQIAPTVRPLFSITDDGRLSQKRLALEKEKAEGLSKKRGDIGKTGGQAKQRNAASVAIATGLPPGLVEQAPLQNTTPSPSPSQIEERKGELRSLVEMPPPPPKPDASKIAKEAASIWNDVCGQRLAKVLKITDARKATFMSRFIGDLGGDFGEWRRLCERVVASPFLTNASGKNNHGWQADFNFVLKEGQMVKIKEGGYDGRGCGRPDNWKLRNFADAFQTNGADQPAFADMEIDP